MSDYNSRPLIVQIGQARSFCRFLPIGHGLGCPPHFKLLLRVKERFDLFRVRGVYILELRQLRPRTRHPHGANKLLLVTEDLFCVRILDCATAHPDFPYLPHCHLSVGNIPADEFFIGIQYEDWERNRI